MAGPTARGLLRFASVGAALGAVVALNNLPVQEAAGAQLYTFKVSFSSQSVP